MAGKIVADIIESAGSQISLNVGNVTILTASSSGLTLTPTSNVNINVSSSTLAFGAGSVSLPSITTSGDTNTGLYFPAADTIGFAEGGAEAMRINSSGNLQANGTISVGAATPSTSGAGITFPATQSASSDANTLDDYEEGTWTPVLTDGTNNVSTYFYQFGGYIKVGRIVTINCTISVNNKGSLGAGTVYITGLPFTSGVLSNSNEQNILAAKVFPLGTTNKYAVGIVDTSLTRITPMGVVNSGQNNIVGSDVTTGSQLFFTGTYWSAN